MKAYRKLVLFFIAPVIVASLAAETFASCIRIIPGPPCQEFWRADAVFIGTASRVVRVPNDTKLAISPYVRVTTHFSVEEAFKGIDSTAVVFDSNDCPYPFKEGERYLVYAHYNTYEKKLDVRISVTRTRPLSEAADDLGYIRGLSSAPAGSRIFGRVLQQGFKDTKVEVEPLPEVRVLLESKDERREVVADRNGRYEFNNLSAAIYRIRVEGPGHLIYREQTLTANERGCIPADIFALHKGEIAGRILDTDGKPVPHIGITLVSADAKPEHILSEGKDKTPGMSNNSDRDGNYRFPTLMPGRYLLIVNRDDYGTTGAPIVRALPRLFYPGVNDIAAATVIVVAHDQKPQRYDFILPFSSK
jgi:hypothetical protein